jgi:hypothetical protein
VRVLIAIVAHVLAVTTMQPTTAEADISGVRIRLQGIDLQFSLPAEKWPSEIRNVLFEGDAIILRLTEIIAAQPSDVLARHRDLTVEVSRTNGGFEVYFLSASIPEIDARYSGGVSMTSGGGWWRLCAIC